MKLKQLGKYIRELREQSRMTQEQLGDKTGVTWEMISRYERGMSSPLSRIEDLAKSLNVSPLDLLSKAYNVNYVSDNKANKVPFFRKLPVGLDFTNITESAYIAPDWILKIDKMAFLIDSGLVSKNEDMIPVDKATAYYISPKSGPTENDLVLSRSKSTLVIEVFSPNTQVITNVIGVVLAKETRLI